MPTSKRRKSRDQSKPVFKKREEPYSYPVGEWLQMEKGLTAAESPIVQAWDARAEAMMEADRRKTLLRDLEDAYLGKAEREQ